MKTNKIIGEKIKNIREAKELTVEEVAGRSGLLVEEIERIEDNIDFPSLSPLIKIARVLGVAIGTFLDDQKELGPVISRAGSAVESKRIGFTNNAQTDRKHMDYYALSQNKSGRHMEPFMIDVTPATAEDEFKVSSHEGEEFIYVVEGEIEIIYGKETYKLSKGDSIYYDSIVSHHVHGADKQSAKILAVIYTPY